MSTQSSIDIFQKDKPEEMMRVLQWVQKVNNVCPCCVVKQQAVSDNCELNCTYVKLKTGQHSIGF